MIPRCSRRCHFNDPPSALRTGRACSFGGGVSRTGVVFIGFVESPAWEGMPSAHPVPDAFRVHSKDFPLILPYRYRLLPASSHPDCGARTREVVLCILHDVRPPAGSYVACAFCGSVALFEICRHRTHGLWQGWSGPCNPSPIRPRREELRW